MAQIGTIKIQTDVGIVEIPVFNEGDSGSNVYEFLKIQTENGTGFVPLVEPKDADYNYIRINTENNGVLAINKSKSIVSKLIDDDFNGSSGDSLGENYLISQGIRKSRNTDTTTFTFHEDGNSNLDFSHDGSGGNHLFGEVATDLTQLSNNGWKISVSGYSYTYNSQQNNIRMGVVDRTDRSNYIEFHETEGSGVNPRIAGNNVNSSGSHTDISFSGGTKYDFTFSMSSGKITVKKNGSEIHSISNYPVGEYVWFVMNENDSDSSASETSLVDRLLIEK